MKKVIFIPILTLIALSLEVSLGFFAVADESSDLDKQIELEKNKLDMLSQQLKQYSPPIFTVSSDVQVDFGYRPINEWLKENTSPMLTINGTGINRTGDVYYNPGIAKAWIEPPRDTKVSVHLSKAEVTGTTAGLALMSTLQAYAEVRVYFSALGVSGNVLCKGFIDPTQVRGVIALQPILGTLLPYVLKFSSVGEITVLTSCGIGALGSINFTIPIQLDTSSSGSFDLGLANTGKIVLPLEAGGKEIPYRIVVSKPNVNSSSDSLQIRADLDITIN
jgi:hypothetical protein